MRDTYRDFYGHPKDQSGSSRYSEEQFRAAINRPNLSAGEALAARFREDHPYRRSHDQNSAPTAHHSPQRNDFRLSKDLTKAEKGLRDVLRVRQAAANERLPTAKSNEEQVVKLELDNHSIRWDEKVLEKQVKIEDQADQFGKSILDEGDEKLKNDIERLQVALSSSDRAPCSSPLRSGPAHRHTYLPGTQPSAGAASSHNPASGPLDVTAELRAVKAREALLQRSYDWLLWDYKDVKARKRKAEVDLEEVTASKRRLSEDLSRERRFRDEAEDDFDDAKKDCHDLEDAIEDYKKKIREGKESRKSLEDRLHAVHMQTNELQASLLQSQTKTALLESATQRAIEEWDALLTKERAATAAASARALELQATMRVVQSLIGRLTSQDARLSVPATEPQPRMDA